MTRYDTQAAFGTTAAWSIFDATTLNTNAKSFTGAAFDGRNLYFVPNGTGSTSIALYYDTEASFTAASSWKTFDMTALNANAKGFVGAAFDGRYLYLVPHNNSMPSGMLARYDTRAGFDTASAWTVFDTTAVDANAKGFAGAAFDGRYLYLVPYNNGSADGVVARFDTKQPSAMPQLCASTAALHCYSGSFL